MKKLCQGFFFCVMAAAAAGPCFAQAYGQLKDMRNTGVAFDGSDPERAQSQGIDTEVDPGPGAGLEPSALDPVPEWQADPVPSSDVLIRTNDPDRDGTI